MGHSGTIRKKWHSGNLRLEKRHSGKRSTTDREYLVSKIVSYYQLMIGTLTLGASGACRTCADCDDSPEDSLRLTLGGRGGGMGGGILCVFGTFTCGECGGPRSLLAAVVLRIIESAVVDEALNVVW